MSQVIAQKISKILTEKITILFSSEHLRHSFGGTLYNGSVLHRNMLTLNNLRSTSFGNYTCLAENEHGSASAVFQLKNAEAAIEEESEEMYTVGNDTNNWYNFF